MTYDINLHLDILNTLQRNRMILIPKRQWMKFLHLNYLSCLTLNLNKYISNQGAFKTKYKWEFCFI